MSPTCTQSPTSECRSMMSWTVSNAPWMSPNAPICMGGRGGRGGKGWRGWRVCYGALSRPSCLSCPSRLHIPSARRGDRGWNEKISFVPHEVVFAVDRELVVLAHENRADRARLFAVAAKNAARLVDLVDRRIAWAGLHRAVVFGGFEVDGVGRAGHRTEAAG